MTPISDIIKNIQEANNNAFDLCDRRPLVKPEWDSFIVQIAKNANDILKNRASKQPFQFYDSDMHLITQLYYYAIGSARCEYALNKGIAVLGSIGRGKTLLMQAFLQIFNNDPTSKNVSLIDTQIYVNRIPEQPELYANNFKRPLYFDDLGKEPSEISIYGSKKHPIGELIAARYNHGAITFLTSNYNIETLSEHYGQHIMDRLREQCTFVYMTGESRRK